MCEDQQQEAFARRFLRKMRIVTDHHQLHVVRGPGGRGAADRFVQDVYVTELDACRRTHVASTLLVLTDGDSIGVGARLRRLDEACKRRGVASRTHTDSVAVFVPTWNIETWFAYLDGEIVDESRKDYPRLPRPRECRHHVDVLTDMCRKGALRKPAPDSLEAACEEYRTRLF